ncbi:MAG: aryl-sulfate sulfotransferase [Peptococcaceae bacterium]|nr:aryl-sulfate sulfotransferase [Peptococcaceae bacterium]
MSALGRGIFAQQQPLTAALEAQLAAHPGTASQPTVVYNPYEMAPLGALVCFDTEADVVFDVRLENAAGETFLRYQSPRTKHHRLMVPGRAPGEKTRLVATAGDGTQVDVVLDAVALDAPVSVQTQGEATEGGWLFTLPADGAGQPVAVNARGELLWTLSIPLNHKLHFLDNGHFLTGAPLQMAPPYSGTALWEMDLLGCVYKEWRFEDGFIGGFEVLEDGTIVAISQAAWQGTVRDQLLWLDPASGEIVKRFGAAGILPPYGGSPGQSGSDWFQGVSLRADRERGVLYWSSLAHGAIFEIDAETAALRRVIGPASLAEKLADGVALCSTGEAAFREPYVGGRSGDWLYVVNANRYPDGKKQAFAPLSVVRVQLETGAVEPAFADAPALASPLFCDLTLAANGDALLLAGGESDAKGLVPAILAREQEEDIQLAAEVLLVHDGTVATRWRFDDNMIFAARWQPRALAFDATATGVIGHWASSFEVDVELSVSGEGSLADELDLHFWQDDARLYLSGIFFKGEACVLILRQGEVKHQFFLVTNRKPYGTEWLYTYISDEKRYLNWAIPCEHLSGTWQMDLLIDDFLYHSDETVTF